MIGKANGSGKGRNRKSRPLEQQRNHGEYRDVNDKPPSRPNAIGPRKIRYHTPACAGGGRGDDRRAASSPETTAHAACESQPELRLNDMATQSKLVCDILFRP